MPTDNSPDEISLPAQPFYDQAAQQDEREQPLEPLPPEREALLAGIEKIDWPNLHHAYGPASDVPDLLRMLLSDDETVREHAWEDLYSNVWHQGTVYEATAYVVPFLLRMLAHEEPEEQKKLLYYLAKLAGGSSYLAVHERSDENRAMWEKILAEQGKEDFEATLQKELNWVKAANAAVGEGVPLYFDLLKHQDTVVRHLALFTLSHLQAKTTEIVPHLQALLQVEPEAEIRTALVHALRKLMDESQQSQHFFAALMGRDETAKVVLRAAAALIERAGDQAPETAITTLLDAWQALREKPVSTITEDVEGWLYPAGDNLRVLASLGQPRGIIALSQALPVVDEAEELLELAGIMLDLAFNNGQTQLRFWIISWPQVGNRDFMKIDYRKPKPQPARQLSDLTEMQRQALVVLVNLDLFWKHQHNLLGLYGLPESREELRQFIS